jgi:hypothetical protein
LDTIQELLVVGAVLCTQGSGIKWDGSNLDATKGLPHIYAPGEGVIKANGDELFWDLDTGAGLTSRTPGTSNGRSSSLFQSPRLVLS